MIALIQRVTRAEVRVDERLTGAIGAGLLALVCADTGCGPGRPIPQNVADEKQQAQRENAIAIGVMSVGLAAAAAGGALLYLNRGLPIYPSIEHTTGGAAVSLGGRF